MAPATSIDFGGIVKQLQAEERAAANASPPTFASKVRDAKKSFLKRLSQSSIFGGLVEPDTTPSVIKLSSRVEHLASNIDKSNKDLEVKLFIRKNLANFRTWAELEHLDADSDFVKAMFCEEEGFITGVKRRQQVNPVSKNTEGYDETLTPLENQLLLDSTKKQADLQSMHDFSANVIAVLTEKELITPEQAEALTAQFLKGQDGEYKPTLTYKQKMGILSNFTAKQLPNHYQQQTI